MVSPTPPAPGQRRLNETLARWTQAPDEEALIPRHIQEWTLDYNPIHKKWRKEIGKLLEQGKVTNDELPLMPMTQEEAKTILRHKQDHDEAEAIKYLAEDQTAASAAGRIYRAWNLNRQVVKDCHVAMAHSISLQATFNHIVGATRFKVFEVPRLKKA